MPVDRLRMFLNELERYGFILKNTGEAGEVTYVVTPEDSVT